MISVKINGIDYAESNYPNYWWFWTWPLWAVFGDTAPSEYRPEQGNLSGAAIPQEVRMKFALGGQGFLTYGEVNKWLPFKRCPCGVGYSPRHEPTGISTAERALCKECGRGADTLILWIGRRTANRWEWKPESELPANLVPGARLETDFDARVKAAVEVEVAIRMAAMGREK